MARSEHREWYVCSEESDTMCKQELLYSCGAACVRQLLADERIFVAESTIREAAEFKDKKGIKAFALALALDQLMPKSAWLGQSVNENSLDALLRRAPFIAMLDYHWVIVDSECDGIVYLRDPWGEGHERFGRVCQMKRDAFIDRFIDGGNQVVYRDIIEGCHEG